MPLVIIEIMPDSPPTFHTKGVGDPSDWNYYLKTAKADQYFYRGPINVDEETLTRWTKAEKDAGEFYAELQAIFNKAKKSPTKGERQCREFDAGTP